MTRYTQLALISAVSLAASLVGTSPAHALGACECVECELAHGTTTYQYEYDADNEDSMKAGKAAQRRVTKMAKDEASDVARKGPLCEAPCEASHVRYFVEDPSFMSSPSGGGYGEAKATWRITGSCTKPHAGGFHLGIGLGIGLGGHHDDHGPDEHGSSTQPPMTTPPNQSPTNPGH